MTPTLVRANTGFLLKHPWQLVLALLGICIGVAVIVAIDLATDSSRKAFLLSMDTLTGKATHQIIGGPGGIDESLYVRLRVEEGFTRIAPVAEGEVMVGQSALKVLGIDPFAEWQFRPDTLQADDGQTGSSESIITGLFTGEGAALMDSQTAASLGLTKGDLFTVRYGTRTHSAQLIGLIDSGSSQAMQDLLVVDISSAQNWLNMAGRLSRIDVLIPGDDAEGSDRLTSILPADTTMLTAQGRSRSLIEMSQAFMTNLTAMSLLALLVGLFLIYNSVSFAVLQRRRLIGILRALGVTRDQVFGLIMMEAAILGLVGAVIGIAIGILLGEQLLSLISRSINDLYFRTHVNEVTVSQFSLLKGLLAGVGATIAAAAVPAFEAAGWRPRLSMTRSTLEQRSRRLLPRLAIGGVVLSFLAFCLLAVSGDSLTAGLTAVFMLILGMAMCLPLATRWITAALGSLAFRVGGTGTRLAVTDISANLSRTGVAIVALAVAVSATIGVNVMVGSFRESVSTWLDQTLQSDIYVASRSSDLDPRVIRDITSMPGVDSFTTSRRAWLEDEEGRIRLIALNLPAGSNPGSDILDAPSETAWQAFDKENALLVSEPFAYRRGVSAGDEFTLNTDAGPRAFPVAGVYRSYEVNAGAILISREAYDRHWEDPGIDSIGLILSPDANPDNVLTRLRGLESETLVVRSNLEIRRITLSIFDRTFVVTDVLYWLATGVALIGILSAMLALQLERARDLAVLRALGMTPGQLGGMITLQTGVLGLLSGLFAVPLGLVMAWVLIDVINRRAFGWQMDILVTWSGLGTAILLAVGSAMLAGLYPAYRAMQSRPALAMREE